MAPGGYTTRGHHFGRFMIILWLISSVWEERVWKGEELTAVFFYIREEVACDRRIHV